MSNMTWDIENEVSLLLSTTSPLTQPLHGLEFVVPEASI
jgi:hypothetical protein